MLLFNLVMFVGVMVLLGGVEGRECVSYIGPAAERGKRVSSTEGWIMERRKWRGRRERRKWRGRRERRKWRRRRERRARCRDREGELRKSKETVKREIRERRIEEEEGRNQLCVTVCKLCV